MGGPNGGNSAESALCETGCGTLIPCVSTICRLPVDRAAISSYSVVRGPNGQVSRPVVRTPHANPARDEMHTIERQAEQLSAAGIEKIPAPNLDWLDTGTGGLPVPDRFILMVPGGAAHRPDKRWPHYADLARSLIGQDLTPVLLGTEAERDVTDAISAACPGAVDLTGRTNLMEIAGLARRATGAVGNDTGPMHLIAATGCPSLVLYSSASDPELCAQRGPDVRILRKPNLTDVGVEEVEAQLTLR